VQLYSPPLDASQLIATRLCAPHRFAAHLNATIRLTISLRFAAQHTAPRRTAPQRNATNSFVTLSVTTPRFAAPRAAPRRHSTLRNSTQRNGVHLMPTETKRRPNFALSAETRACVDALEHVNGDEVSYDALASVLGFLVPCAALGAARRYLLREKSIVWAPITGYGLQRQYDEGKSLMSDKRRRSLGRGARRGKQLLNTIENFAALPLALQLKVTLNQTIFNETESLSRKRKLSTPTPTVEPLDVKAAVKSALATV